MNTFFTCEQKLGNTIFTFSQKAKVLSTSPLNGGLTRHLSHAVNINCMNGSYECKMLGDTYEKDLAAHVHALGLSPSCTTALSTAAWTELRAIEEVCLRDLTVTAVVTGGIDSNGIHPSDPASYYEEDGNYEMPLPGTINIFLFINQNLTDTAMSRALMLCGESKAAAVSQLLLGSCYSEEIATGSGTDGIVIASNLCGTRTLTDASGHSKLGELIGKSVKSAVKQALLKQTAASGPRQFLLSARTARYKITPATLWEFYIEYREIFNDFKISFEMPSLLEQKFLAHNRTSNLVLCVSLYLHLMDQVRWELIMEPEAIREGKRLLIYGLYWKDGDFFEKAYPAKAWEQPGLLHFSLKEQLMYLLLLYIAKLATTSSTGGLSLALQRAIVTARPKGRYRKHFYWPAIKRYYWNLLFSIPLLAHLYISELLHLLYCRLFQHNIL